MGRLGNNIAMALTVIAVTSAMTVLGVISWSEPLGSVPQPVVRIGVCAVALCLVGVTLTLVRQLWIGSR